MKNSVDTIKALAYILFLIAVVVLANTPAHAYDIRATWQLYDTSTNTVIRTLSGWAAESTCTPLPIAATAWR